MFIAVPRSRVILLLGLCAISAVVSCQSEPPPQPQKPAKTSARTENKRPAPPQPEVQTPAEPVIADSKEEVLEPTRQIFRPDDRRPKHDDERLKQAGIGIHESKRLKLYSDIDPEIAATLPSVIDQVYPEWVSNLGDLPPDRNGNEFQITGYLIRDEALFRAFGLVPPNLVFEHGLNSRNEFWMRDQEFDYYRRHLLLHEATHCYMTFVPRQDLPVWYLEGMAEYFASHRMDEHGQVTFGLMPTSAKAFAGFGRIPMIQAEIAANRRLSIDDILHFTPIEFRSLQYYSWSWALCYFLDQSPRYQERFRELSPLRNTAPFVRSFEEQFKGDRRDLATEWALFSNQLQYGYDIRHAAVEFRDGTPLSNDQGERRFTIVADRGWQSSLTRVETGKRYRITATGQFTLSDHPKPWLSEPQGISFQYFDGRPLGQVVACIRSDGQDRDQTVESMLNVLTVGRETELTAPTTGTLYLRVNDSWNSLADNRGEVTVTMQQLD